MLLDQIAGHDRARATLKRAVRGDSPAHAYLFLGPPSVGKTATALAFAGDLLEIAGTSMRGGLHADLWVEDSDAETISIDVIRRDGRNRTDSGDRGKSGASKSDGGKSGVPAQPLQSFLGLRGMHSDRRVVVIARAERLRETAAAPLLKTIEEPPEGAVLILCAAAADLLPTTIRSRCQVLEFSRLTDLDLRDFLARRGDELPGPLLRLARGCPGIALEFAADPGSAKRRLDWGSALESVAGGSWLDVVSLGARFGGTDSGANRMLAREALDCWECWLRDCAAGRAGATDLTGGLIESKASDPQWGHIDLAGLVGIWESAREAADRVENNVNPRLAVEVFLADVQGAHAAA